MSTAEYRDGISKLASEIQDSKVLEIVYAYMSRFSTSSNDITTKFSPEQKQAIDEAFDSIEENSGTSYEDFKSEMKSKHPRLSNRA